MRRILNPEQLAKRTEILAAIGEIAVSTAQLESAVADVTACIDRTVDYDALIVSTPKLLRASRDACRALTMVDAPLGQRVQKWQAWAEKRVNDRHSYVHAFLAFDELATPPSFKRWHIKSGVFREFDLTEAHELACDVIDCAHVGMSLANDICETLPNGIS